MAAANAARTDVWCIAARRLGGGTGADAQAALQLEVDEANARAAEADDALERVRHGTDGALGQLRGEWQ